MLIRGMGNFQAAIPLQLVSTAFQAGKTAGTLAPVGAPPAVPAPVSVFGGVASSMSVLGPAGIAAGYGTPASGTAAAVSQLLPLSGAYDMPPPPPAPVPLPFVAGAASLAASGAAVPVDASVVVGSTAYTPGPNLAALLAALQSAGYTTSDQMVAYLSSLSGQPVNDSSLTEDQASYYLGLIQKKIQESKYLKWGIAGAAVVGLALLLK